MAMLMKSTASETYSASRRNSVKSEPVSCEIALDDDSMRQEVEETLIMDYRLRLNSADFAPKESRPLVLANEITRSPTIKRKQQIDSESLKFQ